MSAKDSRKSLGYAIRASKWSLDTKALDAALSKTELEIAERLRFKHAAEQLGIY